MSGILLFMLSKQIKWHITLIASRSTLFIGADWYKKVNSSIYFIYNLSIILRKIYRESLLCPDRFLWRIYKGPEIPCLRIIKKCNSMNTAINQGRTKVCKL